LLFAWRTLPGDDVTRILAVMISLTVALTAVVVLFA